MEGVWEVGWRGWGRVEDAFGTTCIKTEQALPTCNPAYISHVSTVCMYYTKTATRMYYVYTHNRLVHKASKKVMQQTHCHIDTISHVHTALI